MQENNLKELRKRKGVTQKQLATMLNITPAGVSAYECGRVKLNKKHLVKITEILGCTIADIFVNTPQNNIKSSIPIYNLTTDQTAIFSESNIIGYLITPLNNNINYFALWIKNNIADKAGLPAGSYAICKKAGKVKNGELAVIQFAINNIVLAKYYERSAFEIELEFCSSNPDLKNHIYNLMDAPVNVIGKVIGRQVIDNEEIA